MKTIALEVRDRGTFIPVFASLMEPTNEGNSYLLRRAGYGVGSNLVMLGRLEGGVAHYDVYEQNNGARTMQEAHKYIEKHFHELKDGDVICVETILGERETPKTSERYDSYE